MIGDIKPQLASAEDRLASILSTVAAKDFPDWWITAIRDARAELINMRDALEFAISDIMLAESADQTPKLGRDTVRKVRAALANLQETRWLANAERQQEGIDKSEVEFFEKLRASPAKREG